MRYPIHLILLSTLASDVIGDEWCHGQQRLCSFVSNTGYDAPCFSKEGFSINILLDWARFLSCGMLAKAFMA